MHLDAATAADFEPHLDTDFRVDPGRVEPIALRLTGVRALGRQPGAPRVEPFVLEFSGPAAPVLPQATYPLGHDVLGELDVFLVPVGMGAGGRVQYEAVFN